MGSRPGGRCRGSCPGRIAARAWGAVELPGGWCAAPAAWTGGTGWVAASTATTVRTAL
jgi:hypothetical protein